MTSALVQRGRKSSASLSVLTSIDERPDLQPPSHLTEEAKEVFRSTVAGVAPNHFVVTDVPLIAAYARSVVYTRSEDPALFDLGIRTVTMIATKLRLAPQSRMDQRTGARRTRSPVKRLD